MQLDWFTVVAQIGNFLILVALLKRFLYAPIIGAMDKREAHIATRLQEAQDRMREAEQEAERYDHQLNDLQNRREAMLRETRQEAEVQRQTILTQARQEALQLRERWHETLRHEQDAFLRELRDHAGAQICAVARRVLTDLADADLETHVIRVFLSRLRKMAEDDLQMIAEAVRQHGQCLVIRSGHALTPENQQELRAIVQRLILDNAEVQFVRHADLVCGIELEAAGCKVAWNMTDYLNALEEHFAAYLQAETVEPDTAAIS